VTRILTLTNLYPPHFLGGYELACRDVTERLRGRGHEIRVLTSTRRIPGVSDDPDEHEVDRVLVPSLDAGPWRGRWRRERANHALLDRALEFRPDVVAVWNMGGVSAGLLATLAARHIPLVYVISDEWPVYWPLGDPWIAPFRRRPMTARVVHLLTRLPTTLPDLGASGVFCFVSVSLMERCEREGPWSFPRREITPLGVDPRDFPVAPAPRSRDWGGRLLYVGRIEPSKGIDTAIEALALLPPSTTLDVVGRGDDEQRRALTDLAEQLGVTERVRFDAVDRSRLADRYRSADACVFPSRWEEPFGMVPLEAMACGTPVVATGTGGSGEFLLDGSNCLLFPPGDAASLAAALGRLEREPGLRSRIAAGGADTAGRLTITALGDRLERVFEAAARGG
jgi:glycosyltransferase involved in cell wall biosynthesis